MRKNVSYWLFFICLAGLCNGTGALASGEFSEQSVILCTGNLHLTKAQPVTLESELILWQLTGDYVNVFVRYKLYNSGGARKVRFEIPVDYLNFSDDPVLTLLQEFRVKDEHNTEYHIQERLDELTSVYATRDEEFTTYRTWLTFDVAFPAKAERHLTVSYRVKSIGEDTASYFSYFPDNSRRKIQYSLNSGYLTGMVKQFQVIIDARNYPTPDKKSLQCSLPAISNYDGLINFSATDFDLASLPVLELTYSNRTQKASRFVLDHRAPVECISGITASSSYKENYRPTNMLDGDYSTAWIEGVEGVGVGQWVEVELTNFHLYSLALINGYTKSASTFTVNSKIKKLKLEVECVDRGDPTRTVRKESIITLPHHEYSELNKQFFSAFMDVLADFGDNYVIAKKIRLTILEVEPGTKYDDTGITELYILGNPAAVAVPNSVQTQKI